LSYIKESAKATGGALVWGIVILIIIAILGGLIWGFNVMTSGVKGQGDAVRINNSAENWTEKQRKFEKLNEAVISNKELVALHKENLASDPDNLTLKQTLAGVRSGCVKSVSAYNAESRMVLSQDWKSPDLPYKHDITGCN
jgi:hypothetical protein